MSSKCTSRFTIGAASGLVRRLHTIEMSHTIAIIGRTLLRMCACRSNARRLRRPNVLHRSTIGGVRGHDFRPHKVGVRHTIAVIGQAMVRLCARRSSARRLRRHPALYRFAIGVARGAPPRFAQCPLPKNRHR